ncbi:MAG: class I SAM-dependent methyltransferase [Desulfobacterales bacterium]
MGYVFDFHDAKAYEQWLNSPQRRFSAELETRLMVNMLAPMRGESLLDIGCGTGASLFPFLEMGLQVTGIDPSPYMLDIAIANVMNRVDFYRGFAEDLPFDDNSFNYACLVTTLEFVDDPLKAVEEACRVAKDRIFIGVLNRYAIKGLERRLKGIFVTSIFNRARFFSVWELKQMVQSLMGDPPITWRTVCQLPRAQGRILLKLERSALVQRCPFGAFAGMVVSLVPRFRTRPLTLRYRTGSGGEAVPGLPLTHLNREGCNHE